MGQRAAIYCRVSTADQSCERQERDLTAFASRAGYDPIGIFKETGSGTKLDRAERRKIMALAQSRQIDVILVTELSRWGRSTIDLLNTLRELESWKVSVIAMNGMAFTGYLERSLGITLPVTTLVGTTTLDELAVRLIQQHEQLGHATTGSLPPHASTDAVPLGHARTRCAFALRDLSSVMPLFCIGGLGGTVAYLVDLCVALDNTRPFIAFQAPGTNGAEPPLGSCIGNSKL